MKKSVVLFSILLNLFGVLSCDLLNNSLLKEELLSQIEYSKAQSFKVYFISDTVSGQYQIKSLVQELKVTDTVNLSYVVYSDYQFDSWLVTDKDGNDLSTHVSFGNKTSASTELKILEEGELYIKPVCYRIPAVIEDSFIPKNNSQSGVYKNSTIEIPFNENLDFQNDLSNIEISVNGISVLENFEAPVLADNKIIFTAKKLSTISFDGSLAEVNVTVPAGLYYTTSSGKTVIMTKEWSGKYTINQETFEKTLIEISDYNNFGSVNISGQNELSLGNEVVIKFNVNDSYVFKGWKISENGTEQNPKIEYSDLTLSNLTIKAIDVCTIPVKISPVCYEKFILDDNSFSPKKSELGVEKNSPISFSFNKNPSEKNDLSSIQILIDGDSVAGNFETPILDENRVSINPDNNNFINLSSGTKTVSVVIPSDFYYEAEDGTKIQLGETISKSYTINSNTSLQATLNFYAAGEWGTLIPSSTKAYNFGERVFLSFTEDQNYKFYGWKITNGAGIVSLDEPESNSTYLNILKNSYETVTIQPIVVKRPKITSFQPDFQEDGISCDSAIEIAFNDGMASDVIQYVSVCDSYGNDISDCYPVNFRTISDDGKTLILFPNSNIIEDFFLNQNYLDLYVYLDFDATTKAGKKLSDFYSGSEKLDAGKLRLNKVRNNPQIQNSSFVIKSGVSNSDLCTSEFSLWNENEYNQNHLSGSVKINSEIIVNTNGVKGIKVKEYYYEGSDGVVQNQFLNEHIITEFAQPLKGKYLLPDYEYEINSVEDGVIKLELSYLFMDKSETTIATYYVIKDTSVVLDGMFYVFNTKFSKSPTSGAYYSATGGNELTITFDTNKYTKNEANEKIYYATADNLYTGDVYTNDNNIGLLLEVSGKKDLWANGYGDTFEDFINKGRVTVKYKKQDGTYSEPVIFTPEMKNTTTNLYEFNLDLSEADFSKNIPFYITVTDSVGNANSFKCEIPKRNGVIYCEKYLSNGRRVPKFFKEEIEDTSDFQVNDYYFFPYGRLASEPEETVKKFYSNYYGQSFYSVGTRDFFTCRNDDNGYLKDFGKHYVRVRNLIRTDKEKFYYIACPRLSDEFLYEYSTTADSVSTDNDMLKIKQYRKGEVNSGLYYVDFEFDYNEENRYFFGQETIKTGAFTKSYECGTDSTVKLRCIKPDGSYTDCTVSVTYNSELDATPPAVDNTALTQLSNFEFSYSGTYVKLPNFSDLPATGASGIKEIEYYIVPYQNYYSTISVSELNKVIEPLLNESQVIHTDYRVLQNQYIDNYRSIDIDNVSGVKIIDFVTKVGRNQDFVIVQKAIDNNGNYTIHAERHGKLVKLDSKPVITHTNNSYSQPSIKVEINPTAGFTNYKAIYLGGGIASNTMYRDDLKNYHFRMNYYKTVDMGLSSGAYSCEAICIKGHDCVFGSYTNENLKYVNPGYCKILVTAQDSDGNIAYSEPAYYTICDNSKSLLSNTARALVFNEYNVLLVNRASKDDKDCDCSSMIVTLVSKQNFDNIADWEQFSDMLGDEVYKNDASYPIPLTSIPNGYYYRTVVVFWDGDTYYSDVYRK